MVNLFDITRQSGSGTGLDAWSRQFGLDPSQTMRAVEAVLPAFTLAFQRMAMNPGAFADLTKAIGSGQYASFSDMVNPAQAAMNGAPLLKQLFKSPETTDQVAAQAAQLAGVGTKALQEMMPILAAMIGGGVSRYATVGGFADLLRQWGDALKAASERLDPPKPQDPWTAWQQAASSMMGLPPKAPEPPPPPKPAPVLDPAGVLNAWVAMVGAMTGMSPAADTSSKPAPPVSETVPDTAPQPEPVQAAPEPVPAASEPASTIAPEPAPPTFDQAQPKAVRRRAPAAAPVEKDPNPFESLSHMFETGREVQSQHLAAFQSILDGVWGPTGRA